MFVELNLIGCCYKPKKKEFKMLLPLENLNLFQNFFKAHQCLEKSLSAINKATNAIMGKKFYSKETKKTWRVINAYVKGPILSRTVEVLVEDISTDLKFWSWERLTHGWKHPRMRVTVEVLAEKIANGIVEVIEYEWEDKTKDKTIS